MSDIVDELLEAVEVMKRVAEVNPVVKIEMRAGMYDVLARTCAARKDEQLVASGFLGIPIHINNHLPTACRVHRKDGSTKDLA